MVSPAVCCAHIYRCTYVEWIVVLFFFVACGIVQADVPVSGEIRPDCKIIGCVYHVNMSQPHLELVDVVFHNSSVSTVGIVIEVEQDCTDSFDSVPLSIVIRNWTTIGIFPYNFWVNLKIVGKQHSCDHVAPLQLIISDIASADGVPCFGLELQYLSVYGADSFILIENSSVGQAGFLLSRLTVHNSTLVINNISTLSDCTSLQLAYTVMYFAHVSITNSQFCVTPQGTPIFLVGSDWTSVSLEVENVTFIAQPKLTPTNGVTDVVKLSGGQGVNATLHALSFRNIHLILNQSSNAIGQENCLLHLSNVDFYDAKLLVENIRIKNIQAHSFSSTIFASDATFPISLTRSSLTFRDIAGCGASVVVMQLDGDATMYVTDYSTIEFEDIFCATSLRLSGLSAMSLSQSLLLVHNVTLAQTSAISLNQAQLLLDRSSLLRISMVESGGQALVNIVTGSMLKFNDAVLHINGIDTTNPLVSVNSRSRVEFMPVTTGYGVVVSRTEDFMFSILIDDSSTMSDVTIALYCATRQHSPHPLLHPTYATLPCPDANQCNVDADCFAPNTVGVSGHAGNCQCDCRHGETENALPSEAPARCVGNPTPGLPHHASSPDRDTLPKWTVAVVCSSVAVLFMCFVLAYLRGRRSRQLATLPLVADETTDVVGGKYRMKELLGQGGFGQVYLAECVTPSDTDERSRVVAVKVLHCIDEHALMTAVNECKNMRAVEGHPGIVSMKDMIVDRKESPNSSAQERAVESLSGTSYDSTTVPLTGTRVAHTLYLVMTYYAGGTLEDALKRNPDYYGSTRSIRSFLKDVLGAVGHAHRQNIIHRDLKPSNILLNRYRDVASVASSNNDDLSDDMGDEFVVSDFGMARNLEHSVETHGMGTFYYLAPEQLDMRVSKKSDVWAIACVCVVMASYGVRCKRKDDANDGDLGAGKKRAFWMRRGDADFEDSLRANELCDTPAPLVDLLLAMLSANPVERPTIEECDVSFLAITCY